MSFLSVQLAAGDEVDHKAVIESKLGRENAYPKYPLSKSIIKIGSYYPLSKLGGVFCNLSECPKYPTHPKSMG